MLRKLLFFIGLSAILLTAGKAISATDTQKPQNTLSTQKISDDPTAYKDPVESERLLKERRDLLLKMYDLRVKLITDDPVLNRMHKQIMALHRELAIEIDSKKDMRKLIEKAKAVDNELDKLQKKKSGND